MLSVKVHESRLSLLETKFRNINKSLKGHGQIGYKIVGTSLGNYIDVNGDSHDDGLYFDVETEGAARFANMEYVGKIDVTNSDENVIRPYGKISDSEYAQMKSLHGNECACCNTSRKRSSLYSFRCTETSVNPDNGITYAAGKIYPVGSDCIDKFTGVEAKAIIDTISGEIDLRDKVVENRGYSPAFIDAKKFMMYAMQVSNTHIDDSFSFYKRRAKQINHNLPIEDVYRDCTNNVATYRKLNGSGDDAIGAIAKTALAIYRLKENNYIDKNFLRNNTDIHVLRSFLKLSNFENGLDKMSESAELIKTRYSEVLSDDSLTLKLYKENISAISNSDYIHQSHIQKIVDTCDAYFLSHGSCAMHEDDTTRYQISGHNIIGKMPLVLLNKSSKSSADVIIPYGKYRQHTFSKNELDKLLYSYPVLLTDCVSRRYPDKKEPLVVSLQYDPNTRECIIRPDTRFMNNGEIDYSALKKYRPNKLPINTRISHTSVSPQIINAANKPLNSSLKTGEHNNNYGSVSAAKDEVKIFKFDNNISKVNKNLGSLFDSEPFNHYKGSNFVKGAGQFIVSGCGDKLNVKISERVFEIADYVDDKLGFEEKINKQRIFVSKNSSNDGFKIAYVGFAEDNETSIECQNHIKDVIKDMFHRNYFSISNAKPITDDEITAIQDDEKKRIGRKISKYDSRRKYGGVEFNSDFVSKISRLNDSLLPNDTENSSKESIQL